MRSTHRLAPALAVVFVAATVVAVFPPKAGAVGLPPGTTVVSPPSTVASDCSVDVTKPLYDWLNSLPEGTPSNPVEVVFAPGGCYQVDGMLFLRGFTDFDFNGNGATFRQTFRKPGDTKNDPSPPNRPPYCGSSDFPNANGSRPPHMDVMWFIEGGCDLVFENMDIEGNNTSGRGSAIRRAQDAGIELAGVQRGLVTNDTIHGVYGDFVTVFGLHEAPTGGPSYPSLDITISDNTMKASGRQGVTVVYGQRVAVTGNTIAGNIPNAAIDLESDVVAGTEADINVSNNTISGATWLFSARTGAHLFDIAFENNTVGVWRVQMHPLTATAGHDITVGDNSASGPSFWNKPWSMAFGNLATVLVTGNSVPMAPPTKVFVHIGTRHASTDVAVQDNILNPTSGSPAGFLPTPVTAKQNVKVTQCNNQTADGTPLDTTAHPPNRLQCVSWTPAQPVPPALPEFVTT
ncbi:MAG TPA: right-handed parallel beta-helix repeat-containing protein [Acidimicrobiales bacterium]|nr:right-handed parallel beta-helix repeat-containing protein [Acidimicrobiales bacterium]